MADRGKHTERSIRRRSGPRDERVPAWGVSVFESHHADDFHMASRTHDFLKVLVIQSGSGRACIGGRWHAFEAGDVVIVPIDAENRVEDTPRSPVSLYALCVRPVVWSADPGLPMRLPTGTITLGEPAGQRLRHLLRRLLFVQTTDASSRKIHIAGLALEALATIEQLGELPCADDDEGDAPADPMPHYVAELAHRFYEATTIDAEAARLGMSRRRFTDRFKQHAGQTWLRHVKQLRLAHARHLLTTTRRTVASIAFECGYGDLSTFYRAFTAAHTQSPLEYRQARSPDAARYNDHDGSA